MIKPLCLVDLDDTLFQTRPGLLRRKPGFSAPLIPVALDQQGKPRSFMTQEQHYFFTWLRESTHLIPVTARSRAELARVTLDFCSWKIAAHGALIIRPDGETDTGWRNCLLTELREGTASLQALYRHVRQQLKRHENLTITLHTEYDCPVYLGVKMHDFVPAQERKEIRTALAGLLSLPGFQVHQNNNNIHWFPPCINKGLAVSYLLNRLRGQDDVLPVLGFADSASDYSFLRQCSWYGLPSHSQLDTLLQPLVEQHSP